MVSILVVPSVVCAAMPAGVLEVFPDAATATMMLTPRAPPSYVRYHDTGIKDVHHPIVGDLQLTFEALELPADPGQTLIVYGAEPASATADALRFLASWTIQPDHQPTTSENTGKEVGGADSSRID